ncbi:MAG: response regulator [Candidatus Wallbacteria bacterium]
MINLPPEINTILVVDDSGMARLIIKQCLEIAGFNGRKFLEAINGKDALDKIAKEKVDLVVTDLNMPVMEGTALLENIKSCNEFKHIPVIIISSTSNPAKETELKNCGALAVLNKPVSPASIHKAFGNIK